MSTDSEINRRDLILRMASAGAAGALAEVSATSAGGDVLAAAGFR
jgi:hypothetical protein